MLGALLAPCSPLVAAVARRRRQRIETSMPAGVPPVVVVGNLLVGGTGKTPATLAIARGLQERGCSVGLICGAYRARGAMAGTRSSAPRWVDADSSADEVGDEALLLARASGLPVASGRDRRAALMLLHRQRPGLDVVVSDDGLQHVGLPRRVQLAVFDARGVGNGRVLPSGPLREPLLALESLDAVLLNGTAGPGTGAGTGIGSLPRFRFEVRPVALRRLGGGTARDSSSDGAIPGAPPNETPGETPGETHGLARDVARFTRSCLGVPGTAPPVALAGMGSPQRFVATLESLGIAPVRLMVLPDHARVDAASIADIEARCIVLTDKDAVKLTPPFDDRCWALSVAAHFEPEFFDWLTERLRGSSTA